MNGGCPKAPTDAEMPRCGRGSERQLWEAFLGSSEAHSPEDAITEWELAGVVTASEQRSKFLVCACGHGPSETLYRLVNHLNGNVLDVGISCLGKIGTPELIEEAQRLRAVNDLRAKSLSLRRGRKLPVRPEENGYIGKDDRLMERSPFNAKNLGLLADAGALAPLDGDPLPEIDAAAAADIILRASRKRDPGKAVTNLAHWLVEGRVRPWLAEWDGAPWEDGHAD